MLDKLSENFELILYTSSENEYMTQVMNKLEEKKKYFDFRLSKD